MVVLPAYRLDGSRMIWSRWRGRNARSVEPPSSTRRFASNVIFFRLWVPGSHTVTVFPVCLATSRRLNVTGMTGVWARPAMMFVMSYAWPSFASRTLKPVSLSVYVKCWPRTATATPCTSSMSFQSSKFSAPARVRSISMRSRSLTPRPFADA